MSTIYLKKNMTLKVDKDTHLEVISGIIWVTFINDSRDFILHPTHKLKLEQNKLPVIQALSDACFNDSSTPAN